MHRSLRRRRTSSSMARSANIAIEAIEARFLLTVSIQFDYSKDVNGFFSDPARKAILVDAANAVTGSMTDHLTQINPSGPNTWTATFTDPGTGTNTSVTDLAVPADTIIVYAGGFNLPGSSGIDGNLALGGFASTTASGSPPFTRAVTTRGQPGALDGPPTDFGPAVGFVSFDTSAAFDFVAPGGTIGSDNDFLSVAEHEIAHVLGFGGAPSFQAQVVSQAFTGAKASNFYGGAVPLASGGQDFASGTNVGGLMALMDSNLPIGTRQTITQLDSQALDDIGWDFDVASTPVVSVTATDGSAAEPDTDGSTDGEFEFSRNGVDGDLVINFTVTGTATRGVDYQLLSGNTVVTGNTITILDTQNTFDLTLRVLDDKIVEGNETSVVNLQSGSGYTVGNSITATVSIADDDLTSLQQTRVPAIPVDLATNGKTSNSGAFDLQLSANGRYGTFVSNSTDLVGSPLTTYFQVYRRDFVNGTTTLVSLNSSETGEADDDSISAVISADGRYVAYETNADDIVKGNVDQNSVTDVYVKDMDTNKTVLVSRDSAQAVGGELLAISADGEKILFQSSAQGSFFVKGLVDNNNGNDLFVFNRRTGRYQCLTVTGNDANKTGNRATEGSTSVGTASFSGDGNFVVFPSRASDLVADVTDGNTFLYDVFVRDLNAKKTEYVSLSGTDATKGANNASGNGELTTDGRYVIFRSSATNVVDGVRDENKTQDIFVRDRSTGTTRLLSRKKIGNATSDGGVGVPDISADGRFAVFTSTATDMIAADTSAISDAYIFDLVNDKLRLLSQNNLGTAGGDAPTTDVQINDDATQVIFTSYADNLPGDFDKQNTDFAAIYSHDLVRVGDATTGGNRVISFDRSGNPAGANSSDVVISADGTRVGFSSDSSNLVRNDVNNTSDLFTSIIPGREHAGLDPATGKLTVLGSPINDIITVDRVNSQIVVRRDDETFKFKTSLVKSIDVLLGDGNDNATLGPTLMGTYVSAGSGDDSIRGSGGNDRIQGGPGRDTLYGAAGDDRIDGGPGNDLIFGDAGNDNLLGGSSDDHIYGGGGKDRLTGDIGNDTLDGGSSNDRFYAQDGYIDHIFGGTGNDTAVHVDGDDILDSIEN